MCDLSALFSRDSHTSDLNARYQGACEAAPKSHRRDIAGQLKVPEAALVEHQCGVKSIRLNNDFGDLIEQFPSLGYIMTLTRNEHCVHERKGVYSNVRINGPMGLVITEDRKIDLRIVLSRWVSGFAVFEDTPRGERFSFQFFDATGTAIQKIFLQDNSDRAAYQDLVQRFAAEDQNAELSYASVAETPEYASDDEVDADALRKEWLEMTNVHQFFGMLRRYKVSREQAFRLIGAPLAIPFDVSQLERMLTSAADQAVPIMVFVGNKGNIQIHSGPVSNIKRMGPWLNVLDPEFNLHLMESGVESGWLVRKPTEDGDVTSLEIYDANGETIAQFFGVRQEGDPENAQWRALAESMLDQEVAA